MRESRPYGSVRGALSNERPYRDFIRRDWAVSMGYGDSKLGILSSLHSFAAGRRARLAVRVDDVANLARFQIFTKELFRQTGVHVSCAGLSGAIADCAGLPRALPVPANSRSLPPRKAPPGDSLLIHRQDSGHWPDINAEPPRALSPHRH